MDETLEDYSGAAGHVFIIKFLTGEVYVIIKGSRKSQRKEEQLD